MFLELEKENLDDNKCILSSEKAFLNKFVDSGFKTKWAGFWAPPNKFMDYYAYKVNGAWLSHENIKDFVLQPGLAIWDFGLEGLKVREYVFLWKKGFISLLEFKNKSEESQEIKIETEIAFDFRPLSKDISDSNYESKFNSSRAAVEVSDKRSDFSAMFGKAKSNKGEIEWIDEDKYKEHYPGERQICYIPGSYEVKVNLEPSDEVQVPFAFSFSDSGDPREEFDSLVGSWDDLMLEKGEEYSEITQGKIKTPVEIINKAFTWSKISLNELIFSIDGKKYLFAGLPWFHAEWGRDALWSLLGFIDLGSFEFVEDQLKFLSEEQEDRIPNRIGLEETHYNGADTNPLFLIALDYYEKVSGNSNIKEELNENIEKALDSLKLKGNHANHKPGETWMDTLERGNSAVDIQSLWIEALERYGKEEKAEKLEKGIEEYWNDKKEFLVDSFDGTLPIKSKTINPSVPLMFGQIDPKRANKMFEIIGGEFLCDYGVRSRSCVEKDYSPGLYQKGAVWPLGTLWSACANLRFGNVEEGLDLLRKTAEDIERGQIGAISECLNADSGEVIGCSNQAWSSALFIHAIDRYLFGIKPDLSSGKLEIDPKLPKNWNRVERTDKAIGDNKIDLKIERNDGKTNIALNFEKKPEIDLNFPKDLEVKLNGKRIDKAELRKENIIEIWR